MDLRSRLANCFFNLDGDDRACLIGLTDQDENKTIDDAIFRYVSKLKPSWTYISHFELSCLTKILDIGVQIYVTDENYSGKRYIQLHDAEPSIIMSFKQGKGGAKSNNWHYDASKQTSEAKQIIRNKILKFLGKSDNNQLHDFNILLWNCRSIREYVKSSYMRICFMLENMDVALINESFLLCRDKLFVKVFRVFRSNSGRRRKGVAILVSKNLDADVEFI